LAKQYGGMKISQAKRMKELERENGRLKKAVAELTLDKLILREAIQPLTFKPFWFTSGRQNMPQFIT
jgi:hypothetical protein